VSRKFSRAPGRRQSGRRRVPAGTSEVAPDLSRRGPKQIGVDHGDSAAACNRSWRWSAALPRRRSPSFTGWSVRRSEIVEQGRHAAKGAGEQIVVGGVERLVHIVAEGVFGWGMPDEALPHPQGGRPVRAIPHGTFEAALAVLVLLQPLRSFADPQKPQQTRDDQASSDSPAGSAVQDEIRFRLLSETDFLASHPPVEMARHPADLDAVSCLRIGWYALRIEFSEPGVGPFDGAISASVRTPQFVSFFERTCSWWSPHPEDPAYALAHEQVHFAIAEYEARQLTQEMRARGRTVRGRGRTRGEAVANLEQKLRSLASNAQMAAAREHVAFDSATLHDRARSVQQEWIDRYEKRLGIGLSPLAK